MVKSLCCPCGRIKKSYESRHSTGVRSCLCKLINANRCKLDKAKKKGLVQRKPGPCRPWRPRFPRVQSKPPLDVSKRVHSGDAVVAIVVSTHAFPNAKRSNRVRQQDTFRNQYERGVYDLMVSSAASLVASTLAASSLFAEWYMAMRLTWTIPTSPRKKFTAARLILHVSVSFKREENLRAQRNNGSQPRGADD